MSDPPSPSVERTTAHVNKTAVTISVHELSPAATLSIHPVLSTNKPGSRLKNLLSQLSKLDLHYGSPVLKDFTLFPKLR